MLICQSCGKENLPITDTHISGAGVWGGGGESIELTEYCQFCGARIMELCPICDHLHPLGSIYCMVNGDSIVNFRQQEEAKKLVEQEREKNRKAKREEDWNRYFACYNRRLTKFFERWMNIVALCVIMLIGIVGSVGVGILLSESIFQPESITTNIFAIVAGAIGGSSIFLIISTFAHERLVVRPCEREAGMKLWSSN